MNIQDALKILLRGEDLVTADAESVMSDIMTGGVSPVLLAAFLTALRQKKESSVEVTGFAAALRRHSISIHPKSKNLVDTCGTGGDLSNTFNISTIAAFVAAGAGATVAKHGNRSVSSQCGSADVLEAMGVHIELTPQQVCDCIDSIGIGFMFAPVFHPAMKFAGPVRKELGFRTVFNILGPLCNPAGATAQVMGVYHEDLLKLVAPVLRNLGCQRAFIVHGVDGLDEISITGKTKIAEIKKDGRMSTYTICPEDFDIHSGSMSTLIGGNATQNARIATDILSGRENIGARHDVVCLNAAAVITASGLSASLRDGLAMARHSLESGAAQAKLTALRDRSTSLKTKIKPAKPAPASKRKKR